MKLFLLYFTLTILSFGCATVPSQPKVKPQPQTRLKIQPQTRVKVQPQRAVEVQPQRAVEVQPQRTMNALPKVSTSGRSALSLCEGLQFPKSSVVRGNYYNPNDFKYNYVRPREIKADLLVIYFVSLYCGKCKDDLKYAVEAANYFNNRSGKKVKFIAVGVNNTLIESNLLQNKVHSIFPIIEDPTGSISMLAGADTTPHRIVIKNPSGSNPLILDDRYYRAFSADQLKNELLKFTE